MQAGKLNKRVLLQRRVDTQASDGSMAASWVDVANIWADVRYLSGLEALRSDAPVSVVKASIRIRHRDGVDANYRVVHASAIFNVQAVLLSPRHRECMDLACESGQNNG